MGWSPGEQNYCHGKRHECFLPPFPPRGGARSQQHSAIQKETFTRISQDLGLLSSRTVRKKFLLSVLLLLDLVITA
jgi:hypothetical protein